MVFLTKPKHSRNISLRVECCRSCTYHLREPIVSLCGIRWLCLLHLPIYRIFLVFKITQLILAFTKLHVWNTGTAVLHREALLLSTNISKDI